MTYETILAIIVITSIVIGASVVITIQSQIIEFTFEIPQYENATHIEIIGYNGIHKLPYTHKSYSFPNKTVQLTIIYYTKPPNTYNGTNIEQALTDIKHITYDLYITQTLNQNNTK